MESKTSKNTVNIKRLSLIIGIILAIIFGIILIFTVFKNISPIYLPYQEKEKIVQIRENNNEAQIHIYVNSTQSEDIGIQLFNNKNELIEPVNINTDKYTPKGKFFYVYNLNRGEKCTVKIKNKTNSILFSNIKVQANN